MMPIVIGVLAITCLLVLIIAWKVKKFIMGSIGLAAALISIGTFLWSQKDSIQHFVDSHKETIDSAQKHAEESEKSACQFGAAIGLGCED